MMYYIKPHNEYVCSISVDSDFDFGNGWSLMGETSTHFYMNTDNIDKAYDIAKALGISITTVNTAWEIDPCLLEYDTMYLDTLSWTVEYWDNLPVEMIDAIIATGDEYGFGLYTKAYAYMRNGITVYNNSDIDWDAPAPELPDDEPVHHDVKLDDVELPVEVNPESVEVIVIPQEVVSEPQEDLSTTTQINGDDVMNTSTFIPNWEVSGYVSLLDLDFGTYVPVVEVEPVVEVVKPHYSDKWFGQCCDLNDNPEFTQWDIVRTGKPYFSEVVEFTPLASKAPSIMNIGRDKVSFSKVLTHEQIVEAEARVAHASAKMARRSAYASPVRCGVINNTTSTVATTTKSDKEESNARLAELTTMWERVVNPHAHSTTYVSTPLVDGLDKTYSRPIASATGRDYQYSTQVKEFKSTLFNVDEYDITRNVVVDVATTTPATPKAPATPKPSTAKFANNFNSSVIAKYTALNGGVIRDSLILNKLTSALRANNVEAYANLVTTFGNPTAVALHRKAYDAVISAS